MLQCRRDPNLAQEPVGANHGAKLGLENLERDASVVPEIAREKDGRHPAGSDLALDQVPAVEAGVQLGDEVRSHTYPVREAASRATSPCLQTDGYTSFLALQAIPVSGRKTAVANGEVLTAVAEGGC